MLLAPLHEPFPKCQHFIVPLKCMAWHVAWHGRPHYYVSLTLYNLKIFFQFCHAWLNICMKMVNWNINEIDGVGEERWCRTITTSTKILTTNSSSEIPLHTLTRSAADIHSENNIKGRWHALYCIYILDCYFLFSNLTNENWIIHIMVVQL